MQEIVHCSVLIVIHQFSEFPDMIYVCIVCVCVCLSVCVCLCACAWLCMYACALTINIHK